MNNKGPIYSKKIIDKRLTFIRVAESKRWLFSKCIMYSFQPVITNHFFTTTIRLASMKKIQQKNLIQRKKQKAITQKK